MQTIKRLLGPDFRYLLTTIEYDETVVSGPPHNISPEEVNELFGEFANIERLEEADISFQLDKFQNMPVKEAVYLITPRK
jgi:hypothetical protein